jgi:threonine/homoserine/homoserine lactone efflux protein
MLRYLILGITYAFAAAVQPGPFQTYLISQSLSKGWRSALPAAFAPLISDGPIILFVLLVLSRVPGWLAPILQLAGGMFLLYLAAGAYRSWLNFQASQSGVDQTSQQTILKAALVNLLNPNPYLAWSLVMGPLLLKGWQETPANGIALLAGFYVVMISCQAGIVVLFAAARNLGPRVNRVMIGISVLALACFGIYELWQGIGAFRGILL